MKRRVFISVFAGAAALALATITPAVAQGTFDPPGLNRAIAIQEANTDGLLEIQGVVGTGVGVDARGQAAVIIMTEDVGVRGLPRRLNGVSVVVKVTGKFRAGHHREGHGGGGDSGGDTAIDPTARFERPVPIGVSTGNNTSCSAGTIGARVTDGIDVYALSNNHVYALRTMRIWVIQLFNQGGSIRTAASFRPTRLEPCTTMFRSPSMATTRWMRRSLFHRSVPWAMALRSTDMGFRTGVGLVWKI